MQNAIENKFSHRKIVKVTEIQSKTKCREIDLQSRTAIENYCKK